MWNMVVWYCLIWMWLWKAAAAKSIQSCPTLCDPIDGSPQGSPVPGILQARTLEWVAVSFSNAWKWKVKVNSLSRVRLLATPWTAAYQASPSIGFSRQEYWSGVPLPSLCERQCRVIDRAWCLDLDLNVILPCYQWECGRLLILLQNSISSLLRCIKRLCENQITLCT